MFNIAVAQSGGPTAAINSSLAGVFSGAEAYPEVDEIFGSENGIEGILQNRLLNLRNIIMDERDKQLLMKTFSAAAASSLRILRRTRKTTAKYWIPSSGTISGLFSI